MRGGWSKTLNSCLFSRRLGHDWMKNRVSIPSSGHRFISSPQRPDGPDWLWDPAGNGDRFFFPKRTRQRRKAKYVPPSSVEMKAWSYTSTPPYVLMTWCLVKHRHSCVSIFSLHMQLLRVPSYFFLLLSLSLKCRYNIIQFHINTVCYCA
jgi:hypothetical protein